MLIYETDKLLMQGNQLTGTVTQLICEQYLELTPNIDKELSVDCGLIECTCCTCY